MMPHKVLLSAMTCPSGDLEAGVRRHVDVLDHAAAENCDIAVFPEMSLTGSVEPRKDPELTISADGEAIRQVAASTERTGVAALFGVAERAGEQFHISQIYAHGGDVDGIYHKRHLGEGEEGFTPGTQPATFHLGALHFGVAICAEAGVDFPWHDAADAGASVVFFPAAPGLYGRRTDEAAWRSGFEWWQGAGLADARGHARELGIWVGMATQAGSTPDEDFPSIAALIAPNGEVVDRLPDWRPGTLIVDIPLST